MLRCKNCSNIAFNDNLCLLCYRKFKRNERDRLYNRNHPARYLHRIAKQRAKDLGVEFDITPEDIEEVLVDTCPILGVPLVVNPKKHDWNSYSLDRRDPTRGYVKGNIGVISWRANYIKSNFTRENLEKLLAYMEV